MSTQAPDIHSNPLEAVRCHSKTDIGQKREENQDAFGSATAERFKFYFVCDGMGGVKGGAVASQLAVSVIERACNERSELDVDSIRDAVAKANSKIFERGTTDEQLSGMGTTFVGLAFIGQRMLITSVGDSRAYRIRDGEIAQLTEDHTLVMELLRSGSITEEQAVNHPVSHMLTRSLGPAPEIEIDCWESQDPPLPGDRYLLCSDGLYNMLGIEELSEVILSLPPEEAVEELVSLANLRGGHDNITVMLVSIGEEYPVVTIDAVPDEPRSDKPQPASLVNGAAARSTGDSATRGGEANRANRGLESKRDGTERKPYKQDQEAARESAEATKPVSQVAASFRKFGEIDLAGPRAQAKLLVVLVAALAGAYLLGHLHGANEEESILARQIEQMPPEVNYAEPARIAVAPVAIQPRVEASGSDVESGRRIEQSDDSLKIGEQDGRPDAAGASMPSPMMIDHSGEERRAELQRTVSDLQLKLDAFRSPLTARAGEMLKASTLQIERISRELDATRAQIDSSTRALTIWLGRKKRLQTGDPINLASEVSISSEAVKARQDAFNQVTYSFLQENEVLRFNPGDKARERRVADLARERLAAMRELIEAVKVAIQDELSKVEKQIEASTLARVELENQLEGARRDVEYVKALAGSDPRAREAKQLELQRLLDVARAELEELARTGR